MSKAPHGQGDAVRQFAIDAARLTADTRCTNVNVLDVRGLSPVTDFLVIATGTSTRQMRTVCDDLAEWAGEKGEKALGCSGTDGESWMLIDFVDVVVHIFDAKSREFYDLDNLWGDAERVEWSEAKT